METPSAQPGMFMLHTLNCIAQQMDQLLCGKFTKHVYMLCRTIAFYSKPKLLAISAQLERANAAPDNSPLKIECRNMFKKLICSINTLNNADVHPFGIESSIYFHAAKAQNVLNIKHLSNAQSKDDLKRNLSQRLLETCENIIGKPIVPNINMNALYGAPADTAACQWIRCQLQPNTNIYSIYERIPLPLQFSHCWPYSDTVCEFYFFDTNVGLCLEFFNSLPEVVEIIFYSNLKRFQNYCDNDLLNLSNCLKFYYCYRTEQLTFAIIWQSHVDELLHLYSVVCILLHKSNMKISRVDDPRTTTPLNILTGSSPNVYIVKYMYRMTSNTDDPHAEQSAFSRSLNQYHPSFMCNNDREYRIVGRGTTTGANNVHDLIFHLNTNVAGHE